jgi:hypothetical protein
MRPVPRVVVIETPEQPLLPALSIVVAIPRIRLVDAPMADLRSSEFDFCMVKNFLTLLDAVVLSGLPEPGHRSEGWPRPFWLNMTPSGRGIP